MLDVGRWMLIRKKSIVHGLRSVVCPPRSSDLRPLIRRRQAAAAFTLMELLVVMAVIVVLIGLLFPALMGARERSKITRARSEIQTLQEAWLAYWNTYGKWPDSMPAAPTAAEMNPDAVEILAGIDEDANPQKIAFMEFDERHLTEGFKDPWLENYYKIVLSLPENPEDTEIKWVFKTRVHCINTARYKY